MRDFRLRGGAPKLSLVVSKTESEKVSAFLSVCLSVCLYVRMRVTLWSPTDISIFKRLRPCCTHQVEALAEAID